MFLSFLMWALCLLASGQWWVGPLAITALVAYAITDQNAEQKRVRIPPPLCARMVQAQERARQANADAAVAQAEAIIAAELVRILRRESP
jgi:hypothetical protein